MDEKQKQKPEYHLLATKQNMIIKVIVKLNRKMLQTSDIEKKYKIINKINEHSTELIKINSIANFLDGYSLKHNPSPEKIAELSEKLLNDSKAYNKALRIDKRKNRNFEF